MFSRVTPVGGGGACVSLCVLITRREKTVIGNFLPSFQCSIAEHHVKARPLTLYGIEGHLQRRNDAVFQPALPRPVSAKPRALANQQTLVFFGGDMQNLAHLMDQTDDSVIDYQTWCLEETALRLSSDFPYCHIVVIKPSRVVFDHISCFDNFVESNIIGIPKHYYHYVALMHLEKLLKTISRTLRQTDPDNLFKMLLRTRQEEIFQEKYKIENATSWEYENISAERKRVLINWQKNLRLHKYPLKLLAFGKGCVVLNQFLYEFHYAKGLEPKLVDSRFIDRIRDIYWLDSGNCGRQNVYVTSLGLLKTLAALDLIVHVHGSMYMTEDENRPWIRKQFNEFIKGIIKCNGKVIHFRHVSISEDLESHFQVLLKFKYAERREMKGFNSPRIRRIRKVVPVPEEPAMEAPVRVRARPEIQPQSETIGFCLVNPYVTPYLGLQMLKLKPGFKPEPSYIRTYCPEYRNAVEILSSDDTQNNNQTMSVFAEPFMPAQTPPTPVQRTSAQMPSISAEPSTSEQTPSTTVQNPSPFMVVSSSNLLPNNYNINAPVLWNELVYLLTEEEVLKYKNTSYCKLMAPVVAIPSRGNPLSLHVFWPYKDIYVPTVYNHHFVVNRNNTRDEGEDLPAFLDNEEPPPAADGLNPRRATSSSNSMAASRSARNATSSVNLSSGPRADVSSPDVSNPDSADDVSNPDSAEDVSNPNSVDDVSNPDSVDDVSNPDSVDEVSNPDSVDDVSNPDSDDEVSNLGSADEVSNSDSVDAVSNPDSADDVSNPDSEDDVSNPDSADDSNPYSAYEVSNPDSADEVSNPDSADEVSNPDSADDVSNPHFSGSADDASASDSDISSSLRTLRPVNSRIGSRSGLGHTLSTSSLINGVSDVHAFSSRVASASGLTLHSTSVTQLEPNTVGNRPVISQRATRISPHIAQPEVSQNQIYSQSTSPGSHVAISSIDSVAPRAGTSRARVRARDVDDEPPCPYNLRKRPKRSYNDN